MTQTQTDTAATRAPFNSNSMTHRVLDAIEVFIGQRSRMDWRDYGTDANGRKAYQSEARSVAKDGKEARAALHEAHSMTGQANGIVDTLPLLVDAFQRAFSGRLKYHHARAFEYCDAAYGRERGSIHKDILRSWLSYTTGQYFPTEYRKAARAVLGTYASAVRGAMAKNAPQTFTYRAIADVRAANKAVGGHWFDRSSMRFFNSVIESGLIGGRFFVTSERMDLDRPKLYSVREAKPTGEIDTVGEFQGYRDRTSAVLAARCVRMGVAA